MLLGTKGSLWQNRVPVAHSSDLSNTQDIGISSFSVSLSLVLHLCFLVISSQINYLHQVLVQALFGGNPRTIIRKMKGTDRGEVYRDGEISSVCQVLYLTAYFSST